MGIEHIQYAPEWQGANTNYCWAAGLSWWLKAVRRYKYDFETIKDIYANWTKYEQEGFGSLTDAGMYKMLNDSRWHLSYEETSSDKFTESKIKNLLRISPVIIGYHDNNLGTDEDGNKLTGFHMNVIVAEAGSNSNVFTVMDPNYKSFQTRNIQYYKEYYCGKSFLAYSMTFGNQPTYGYSQSY